MGRKSRFVEYIGKLKNHYFMYRRLPSFDQLTEILGVGSKRTAHRFYQECIEQGYLEKHDKQYLPTKKLSGLPLFSSVPAGSPDDADNEKLDDVNLDELLIAKPNQTVMLTAKGESMVDAGIMSGDMMIVDTKKPYYEGDIVIGIVDGEYTVKYLHKNKENKRYLKAANAAGSYPDIYADQELSIYGVVSGIVRKL